MSYLWHKAMAPVSRRPSTSSLRRLMLHPSANACKASSDRAHPHKHNGRAGQCRQSVSPVLHRKSRDDNENHTGQNNTTSHGKFPPASIMAYVK